MTYENYNAETFEDLRDSFERKIKALEKGGVSGDQVGQKQAQTLAINVEALFKRAGTDNPKADRHAFVNELFYKEFNSFKELNGLETRALRDWSNTNFKAINDILIWLKQDIIIPDDLDATLPPANDKQPLTDDYDELNEDESPAPKASSTTTPDFSEMATDEKFEWLAKPFSDVKKFPKGGTDILYITRPQIIRRLNTVIGFANWQDEITNFGTDANGKSLVKCKLSIWIDDAWISREDIGTESEWDADKGAATDAFKRAAKKFTIGLYLDK